ncbi:MAG: hypothetical protein EBR01_10025 [Proteobacteria bacterium]|nr:hypothetical protein [Pseudomonadota bacterium]
MLQKLTLVLLFVGICPVIHAFQCEGSQFIVDFSVKLDSAQLYNERSFVTSLNCINRRTDAIYKVDVLCRVVDEQESGYEIIQLGAKIFKIYALSFAGKKQLDVVVCD